MRVEQKLALFGATGVHAQGPNPPAASTPAPTWQDSETSDYDNNKTTFDNIEINQVVLAPGNEKAVVFTSNGAAYTVDQNTSCDATEGVKLSTEAIRRRKTHTRIQQEVEFWVPKTMAIATPSKSTSLWTTANYAGGYATCVVFAASDVAVFEWVGGKNTGGESVPVISKLSLAHEPTRVMCGVGGSFTPETGTELNTPGWEMPGDMTDAEFHAPRNNELYDGSKGKDTTFLGAQIPKLGVDCGDTYSLFGMNDMICSVLRYKDHGYIMCLLNNAVQGAEGQLAYTPPSRLARKGQPYYPFSDTTADKKNDRGSEGVLAADGTGDVLCRADSMDGKNSKVSCIDSADPLGKWAEVGAGAKAFGQEQRDLQGHGNCNIAQVAVVPRGSGSSRYVVYGVCNDGTLICAGGPQDGFQPGIALADSACGLEGAIEGATDNSDGNWYRFDVRGYFMEPDANAHKDDPDTAYAPKKYTSVTTQNGGSSSTELFWSTKTASYAGTPPTAAEHFDDQTTSKTSGLYDGTMFDITGSMTGDESVVCIKNSTNVLAIQTKSGRLLVNSTKLTFPYKYGVVFVTSPLQTRQHEHPSLPYPSATSDLMSGTNDGLRLEDTAPLNSGNLELASGNDIWAAEEYDSAREMAGYEDYAAGNVTNPGSFYQVMMSDQKNTQMPHRIMGFTIQSSKLTSAATLHSGTEHDVLWVAGNLGYSKVTQLKTDWKDTPWLGYTSMTSASASKSDPAATQPTVADQAASSYGTWNAANDADTDTVAECGFSLTTGATNLTFCLSSVGICSFHVSPYDHDAIRDDAAGTKLETYKNVSDVPQGWSATSGASAGGDNISEESLNHQWTNSGSGGMIPEVKGTEVEGQCLSLYSFHEGCVLLTGIDDTNMNMRNNDYFDCKVVLLVMNYGSCVINTKPIWFEDSGMSTLKEESHVFSVTYANAAGNKIEKDLHTNAGAGKVMYMADTLRNQDNSHLFQSDRLDSMTALNIEMRCSCIYDIEQQVNAGILAASGSLGSATQNEVTTQFDLCIAIAEAKNSTQLQTLVQGKSIYQMSKEGDSDFVFTKCSQDPKKYGEGLNAGEVTGTAYQIFITQDTRSLPKDMSFLTDAYMYPSNHANEKRANHVAGTSDSPDLVNWDPATAPEGTGLVYHNCGGKGHANWGGKQTSILNLLENATSNFNYEGSAAFKDPAMDRAVFDGVDSGNTMEGTFGIAMNTTAWMGYSYNLFYVRTTRCKNGTDHCLKCSVTRRRMLEASANKSGGNDNTNFTLKMKNPKYILDPSSIVGDFSERAEYDPFNSAVAVALFGLVSMLF